MPKHNRMTLPEKMPKGHFKKTLITLLKYCKDFLPMIIIAAVAIVASAVLGTFGPKITGELIDVIREGAKLAVPSIDMDEVTRVVIILVVLFGLSMLLNYVSSFLMTTVSCRISQSMRRKLSEKIDKIPLNYYDTHNFGDTLSCITNDVDTVSQSLSNSIGTLVSAITTLVGCLVMMFVTQWIIAFAAIGSTLIGFLAIFIIMAKSQKYFNARQQSLAALNGHIEEYFAGQNIVRAYNAESDANADFTKKNDKLKNTTFKAEFLSGLMGPLMSFIGNFGYVVVCIVGASLAFSGKIGFGVVVAFMMYVRMFTSPLGQIGQGISGLQSAAAAADRVFGFLAEAELSDESGKTAFLDTAKIKGDVTFSHVHFGYNPDKIIINDFSMDIKSGQKIAIVGPTGAGKTTIVNLLMRFYELNGGNITVDGVPLSDITRHNVHDVFGMVLQDTWLFHGTLRENLAFGKTHLSDEDLLKICDAVGLTHFVKTLPKGLDTVLDDAVTISAGQKQLITIARAMAENAPLLILDEATSSVDTRTEIQIQHAMEKLTEGRTSFVIAHRLSTIKDSDCIIVLKDGDIIENGNHNALMKKKGFYYDLYNSQFSKAA